MENKYNMTLEQNIFLAKRNWSKKFNWKDTRKKVATERAIEYMLYGMRSQLFWDGNKRTSNICANKIIIQNGAGIIKVPENKIEQFNVLLTDFYNTNEKEKIKNFIFENCIDGIKLE